MAIVAGMDVGASGVKLAKFSGKGKKATCLGFEFYDAEAEGVLDESEMLAGAHDLLAVQGHALPQVEVGLSSYEVTIKVGDYPPVKERELASMVELETLQVAGLSDESFLHGYVHLPSGWERKHPVLLGMCRETTVRQHLDSLEKAGFICSGLQPGGLALAVSAFALIPGLQESSEPAVLLDIGKESTDMVIIAGGQILYQGGLMFGAEAFMAAGREHQKRHHSMEDTKLSDYLPEINLEEERHDSEFIKAACVLDSELQNSLEQWRTQELPQLSSTPIPQVYITGGGSCLGGLVSWLTSRLECQVHQFGPQWQGRIHPELTIAYGLGLQAAEATNLSISLLPGDVASLRLRKKRWPLLAIASALAVGTSLAWLGIETWEKEQGAEALTEKKTFLQSCVDKAGQLKVAMKASEQQELLLGALVRDAAQGRNLQKAIRALGKGNLNDGWLIYVADQGTAYDPAKFFQIRAKEEDSFIMRQRQDRQKYKADKVALPEKLSKVPFICAGYVPMGQTGSIRKFMADLRQQKKDGPLFKLVDRGNSIDDTAGELIWQWRKFLNREEARLREHGQFGHRTGGTFADNFELFTLVLPLASNQSSDSGTDKK